jgi:hypothetical protein
MSSLSDLKREAAEAFAEALARRDRLYAEMAKPASSRERAVRPLSEEARAEMIERDSRALKRLTNIWKRRKLAWAPGCVSTVHLPSGRVYRKEKDGKITLVEKGGWE